MILVNPALPEHVSNLSSVPPGTAWHALHVVTSQITHNPTHSSLHASQAKPCEVNPIISQSRAHACPCGAHPLWGTRASGRGLSFWLVPGQNLCFTVIRMSTSPKWIVWSLSEYHIWPPLPSPHGAKNRLTYHKYDFFFFFCPMHHVLSVPLFLVFTHNCIQTMCKGW